MSRRFNPRAERPGRGSRAGRLRSEYPDRPDWHLRHETILSIATRWGISSSAHFSRLYRARYGSTPREERRTATGGA